MTPLPNYPFLDKHEFRLICDQLAASFEERAIDPEDWQTVQCRTVVRSSDPRACCHSILTGLRTTNASFEYHERQSHLTLSKRMIVERAVMRARKFLRKSTKKLSHAMQIEVSCKMISISNTTSCSHRRTLCPSYTSRFAIPVTG